jgi:arsenate reductase
MGEAFMKKYIGNEFRVFSAGIEPKAEVFPPVVEVMREIGIDISDQKPKGVEAFLGKVYLVIVVCHDAEKRCPNIFASARRLFWPFDDPAAATGSKEEVLSVCRNVRDRIEKKIHEWLKEQGIPTQPSSGAGG